jgi:hypothetical protein
MTIPEYKPGYIVFLHFFYSVESNLKMGHWGLLPCSAFIFIFLAHSLPTGLHKEAFLHATDHRYRLAVLTLHKLLHNSQIPTAISSLQALAKVEGRSHTSCSLSLHVMPFCDPSLTHNLKEVRLLYFPVYTFMRYVHYWKLVLDCVQGVRPSAPITCSMAAVPGHQHVPGAVLHRHQHSFRLPFPGGSATRWPRRRADRSVPC